jgi:hypothetical protein
VSAEIETARQTVADLEQKLASITARSIELADERRHLAFDANTGDGGAEKKLKALNSEAAHINLDIENVRSAIEEAKRRLNAAIRDEEMADDRKNAEAALVIGDRLAERGKRIDEALATAQQEIEAFKRDVDELHQLGCPAPTGQQFLIFGGLALSTFVMATPVKVERTFLAPAERRTFVGLSGPWRDSVCRWAGAFLVSGEAA